MRNTSRHHVLLHDLRSTPERYFDAPSALTLAVYLHGYFYRDRSFWEVYAAACASIALQYRTTLSLGAACLLYASDANNAVGYDKLLSALEQALEAADELPPSDPDVDASLAGVFDIMRQRPAMLIGSSDVLDVRYFLDGLLRARDDAGEDTTDDRHALDRLEAYIQQDTQIVGRWERIIRVQAMCADRSIKLFFVYCDGSGIFASSSR